MAIMPDSEDRSMGPTVAVLLCASCYREEGWGECAEGVYPLVLAEVTEPDDGRVRYGEPVGTWYCARGRLRTA